MLISDLIISTPTGNRLDLSTHRATNVTVQQTKHGYGSISFDLPISPAQLVLLYGNPRVLDISLKHASTLFNGRLEDLQIKSDTLTFTALGYWRSFSDINYSAMWSVTKLDDFTSDWIFNGSATPSTNRWFDINISNDVVTIGLVKNSLIVGGSRAQVA